MKDYKKFKMKCPNCFALDKIIKRCPLCFRMTCSECSIEKLCFDCYILSKDSIEINRYFAEKYRCGTII